MIDCTTYPSFLGRSMKLKMCGAIVALALMTHPLVAHSQSRWFGWWEHRRSVISIEVLGNPDLTAQFQGKGPLMQASYTHCIRPAIADQYTERYEMAEFAGCVVHHRTQSPNKIDAFMTCVRAGLTVTHDVVGSFSPSLVEKTIITTEDSKRMTTRVTDTWLGDCE